jgi:hypothetical protein
MGDLRAGDVIGVDELKVHHRDFYKGIYVPAGDDVAASIRFRPHPNEEYGYADRWIEEGVSLDYTGQGPPPQNQSWNRFNLGLLNAERSGSRVQVFEEQGGNPRTYRYHGAWRVERHYEFFNEAQQRQILRFVLTA